MTVGGGTRLVFLAGDPVGHTKGYAEYAAAFSAAGIDAAYVPADVPAGRFAEFLAGLRWARNVAGVVATVPHKLAALAAATVADEAARLAGSANVLRPHPEGGWACTQVDGAGFLAAAEAAGIGLAGRRVQVLGAGGAGRAVAMAIAGRRPASLLVHDPDPARQEMLARDLGSAFAGLDVNQGLERCEVLVNCSSVGMGADERLPLPPELIPVDGACYDIVNRADTALLRAAAQRRCVRDHGRSMMLAEIPLILQYLFS